MNSNIKIQIPMQRLLRDESQKKANDLGSSSLQKHLREATEEYKKGGLKKLDLSKDIIQQLNK